MNGLDRIFNAPEFDGEVEPGRDYLILDDTLTQGGTFAALASHIEAGGGRMVGAVALTGKQYSAKLRPSDEILAKLREKHGDLENDFRIATGYGFDSLTESEARYLANFKPAVAVRDRIAAARVDSRDGLGEAETAESKDQRDLSGLKERLSKTKGKVLGGIGNLHWKRTPQAAAQLWSNLLTDAMGKDDRFNALSLVPGRPLFTELGKNLSAAQDYLSLKEKMDAERNEWQALSAETVDRWSNAARKNPQANERLMELMHDSTVAQIDPSKPEGWKHPIEEEARRILASGAGSKERMEWARGVLKDSEARAADFPELQAKFQRLPKPLQDIYHEVRDSYSKLADAHEAAVIENIRQGIKATLEQARRDHRKEQQRIKDEMAPGAARTEALGKANAVLSAAEARAGRAQGSFFRQLRHVFESNRLQGPYFPLSRQGNYFAAVRDAEGNLLEFQKFEKAADQEAFATEAAKTGGQRVFKGVITNAAEAKEAADPRFVSDVERLLADLDTGSVRAAPSSQSGPASSLAARKTCHGT